MTPKEFEDWLFHNWTEVTCDEALSKFRTVKFEQSCEGCNALNCFECSRQYDDYYQPTTEEK